MSEFDTFLASVMDQARDRAAFHISSSEEKGTIISGMNCFKPSFTEEQKQKIMKNAADEAVRKIFENLSSVAFGG